MAANLLKSEFHLKETIFSVHVTNGQEVKMDPSELEAKFKWPIITKKNKVPALLGCTNYFRQFIVNYSARIHSLVSSTKDVAFT